MEVGPVGIELLVVTTCATLSRGGWSFVLLPIRPMHERTRVQLRFLFSSTKLAPDALAVGTKFGCLSYCCLLVSAPPPFVAVLNWRTEWHEMGKKDGIQRRSFCPVIIVGKTTTWCHAKKSKLCSVRKFHRLDQGIILKWHWHGRARVPWVSEAFRVRATGDVTGGAAAAGSFITAAAARYTGKDNQKGSRLNFLSYQDIFVLFLKKRDSTLHRGENSKAGVENGNLASSVLSPQFVGDSLLLCSSTSAEELINKYS
jgi:hypothetical protein